jgi:hypothetical protein
MKKLYNISLVAVFMSVVTGSVIAGVETPGSDRMFNPQPEPPAYKVFKLNDGRLAYIMERRLYLLAPAPKGRYKAANGYRFDVGTQGNIIKDKLNKKMRMAPDDNKNLKGRNLLR